MPQSLSGHFYIDGFGIFVNETTATELFDANMSPQGICTVEKRFDLCFVVTHRFYELSYKNVLSCT